MKSPFRLFLSALAVTALAALCLPLSTVHAQATIYNQPADGIAQIVGGPGAPTLQPTFATTVTLKPNLGIVHQIKGVNSTSATCTLNAGSAGGFGQFMVTICSADATGTVTYTFGTNFLPTATAAPTASTAIVVGWISDGIKWRELGRSASAQ